MAVRKTLSHDQRTREKIRTSQLINRLQDNAFGKVELTATQIKSIEILLKKSIPDLQAVQFTGEGGGPVEFAGEFRLIGVRSDAAG